MKSLVFLIAFLGYVCAQETKIKLTTANAIDGFATPPADPPTPATNMLDEQDIAGDPANGNKGTPKTAFFPGWTGWYYPDSFYLIDFVNTFTITSMWMYTDWGGADVNFSLGPDVAHWTKTWSYKNSAQGWDNFTLGVTGVRYFKVQFNSAPGDALLELVFYGTQTAALPVPTLRARPYPLLNNFIGSNVFFNDPVDKIVALGVAREYHVWGWDEGNGEANYTGYPKSQNKFQPAYPAPDWLFDTFYNNTKNAGVEVHHCMQQTAPYIKNNDFNRVDEKPLTDAQMQTAGITYDPSAYAAHADHAYQVTARYGKTQHPASDLKLASDQPILSGANLLNWMEYWNEQDKWWEGRASFFAPWEYAAMLSADYDGHMGTMDKTVGTKNADPNMKVVMGGIADAGFDLNYVRSMKAWTDAYRNGSFPAEALNFHHYCNNGNGGSYTTGISPEADNFGPKSAALVQWRDANLPNAEVWISEWGWDTNQGSPQKAPAIGSTSGDIVQAQWIIRAYLVLAAAGVDRTHHFMLKDVDGGYGVYASSGLIKNPNDSPPYGPKPSWYYVYTLKNRLGEMAFVSTSTIQGAMVSIFKTSDQSQIGYVAWSPTSNNVVINNFQLNFTSGGSTAASALVVQFVDGQTNGNETKVAVTNGGVTITVSETPIIVLVQS